MSCTAAKYFLMPNKSLIKFVLQFKPSAPRLSYLVENFQGGEVVHFFWLDLHLHVASSLGVDAFMPEGRRTDGEVAHWASTRGVFTPQVSQILPFCSSYLVKCDQTAQWRHYRV